MAGENNDNNPFVAQVRIAPVNIQLVPGPKGDPGPTGGVITTSANFTQPAVNANVVVSVTTTTGIASGETVFVQGGGFYSVGSIGSGVVTITNLGTVGVNINPGLTVSNGAIVAGSGPAFPANLPSSLTAHAVVIGEGTSPVATAGPGTAGQILTSNGASADPTFQNAPSVLNLTLANFTQPAIGSTVSVNMTTTASLAVHGFVTVVPGGRYTVSSITDGTHAVLVNRGGSPNVSPTTVVTTGAVISLEAPNALETIGGLSPFALAPVNNVMAPEFGAVGDDSTDDTAAWTAAFTAAASNGFDVYAPPPPVAYKITAMLQPPKGITIRGAATALGQCIIRAHASMLAVLSFHTTDSSALATVPGLIENVTLDANSVGSHALLRNGDFLSRIENVGVENAIYDGLHASGHRLPAVIGSVTTGGGAPAGLTVSQPDVNYIAVGTITMVIKAVSSSAYVTSLDGGATFSTLQQAMSSGSTSNVVLGSLSTPTSASGLQIHFPVASFVNGNTWTFTITIQAEDGGESHAINTETSVVNLWARNCGTQIAETGTCAVTTGSTLVTGTGTTWLTSGNPQMRPGDSITIVLSGIAGPGSTQGTFPILCVADDTHIYLQEAAVTIQTSGSGLSFHRNVGYGVYEDDSGDNVRNRYQGGRIGACANGIRVAGDISGGPLLERLRVDDTLTVNTGIGILFGGILTHPQGIQANCIEVKQSWGCMYYFPAGTSTTLIEPQQTISPFLPSNMYGGGIATLIQGGSILRYAITPGSGFTVQGASSQPFCNLQLIANIVSVTAANQVLAAPQLNTSTPLNTAYTILQPNADYAGANGVLLALPNDVGQVWCLEVDTGSAFAVGIQDASVAGTNAHLSGAAQVLFGGERLWLLAVNNVNAFTPKWEQMGEVQRQWHGPRNRGSGTGKGSDYIKTSGTTPGVVVIDLTFAGSIAFVIKCRISAQDTGNTDWAIWDDVRVAVDSSPALVGVKTTAEIYGSNAGGVPATWGAGTPANAIPFAVVNVAGDFQLQFQPTGATGRTIKWFLEYETISVVRF